MNVSSIFPVVDFKPKMYNNIATITVISTNGINTIIHEMMLNPPKHNTFNKNPMTIITKNFIRAVL